MDTASAFRAEVVGSLLRPEFLRTARADRDAGRLTPAAYKEVEDRAVDEALAAQAEIGLDTITDGEVRRNHFLDALEAMEGLVPSEGGTFRWRGPTPEEDLEYRAPLTVTSKVRLRRSIATEEFVYARARSTVPVKVTLPSPMQMYFFWSEASRDVYPDPFDLFADAAEVIRAEARELIALGCRYIQVDAPEFAFFVDDELARSFADRGMSAARVLTDGVDIINGIPTDDEGVRWGMHLCRGNFGGRWLAAGGYGAIAREVFGGSTRYDAFFLEYDDDRSGSFESLREVPEGKQAVLGLVSTKRNALEPRELIVRRIHEASGFLPKEQLGLSPQCGFGTDSQDRQISEALQRKKLELVVDVAREVWG